MREKGLRTSILTEPEEKAKVAIIGVVDQKPSVFLLRRSPREDTRIGGDDWPGGKLELGELPIDGLLREAHAELPGVMLQHIVELEPWSKKRLGQRIVNHFFAATAVFPPPEEHELSNEHDIGEWVSLDELYRRNLPQKYQDVLTSPHGLLVVSSLVVLAQNQQVPQEFPAHLYA